VSERPDELVTLGRPRAKPEAPPRPAPALPLRVELPTRYYGRIALGETMHAYADLAEVELKAGDGALAVTFLRIDAEAGDPATVIDEFLNHALLGSVEEGTS
jgi:hypothetical protein